MPKGVHVKQLLLENSTIAHPSSLFIKKDIMSVGSYRSFYEYAEDYDLWLRVNESYKIGNINQFLTDYRVHSSQLTKSKLKRHVWAVLAVKESLGLRISGLPELHESFPDISAWKKQGNKRIIRAVTFRVMYSKAAISKANSVYKMQNLGHLLFVLILNPNFFISSIRKKFSE